MFDHFGGHFLNEHAWISGYSVNMRSFAGIVNYFRIYMQNNTPLLSDATLFLVCYTSGQKAGKYGFFLAGVA